MPFNNNPDAAYVAGFAPGPYDGYPDIGRTRPELAVEWRDVTPADFVAGNLTPSEDPGGLVNSLTYLGSGVYRLDVTGTGVDRDDPATGANWRLKWPSTPPQAWVGDGTETLTVRVTPQNNATALGTIFGIGVADRNGIASDPAAQFLGAGAQSFNAGVWRAVAWTRATFATGLLTNLAIADGPQVYGVFTFFGAPGDASNVGVQPVGPWKLVFYAYRTVTDAFSTRATLEDAGIDGAFRPVLFAGYDGTGVLNQVYDFKVEWCIGGGVPFGTY